MIGCNFIKIGYGKVNFIICFWVGGLGFNILLVVLVWEFDCFGSIWIIDYVKGDSFVYI